MSVHFYLTIEGNIISEVARNREIDGIHSIGICESIINGEGVHWAQNFADILCMSEDQAASSESHLWYSKEASAQIRLNYLIERVRYAMSETLTMHGYGQRVHLAELLSLLHAAQTLSSLHRDERFEIRWF